MSNPVTFPDYLLQNQERYEDDFGQIITEQGYPSEQTLPGSITRDASKQTYYTIKVLVDRERTLDAYRAYAYFRWVDDALDQYILNEPERIAFLKRQQAIMECSYRGEWQPDLSVEESMLADLIRSDQEPFSGLQAYLRNMMAVMAFDVARRGRLISQHELTQYSRSLSTAVTEALHYFIGHDDDDPGLHTPTRYIAVTAAHITHMLRDTFEDVAAGYFNIASEFLDSHKLDPCDIKNDAHQLWVKNRVQIARTYFNEGKGYLRQVKNLRCRIAGYAYIARFESVLDVIERDAYQIRPEYPERKSLSSGMRMGQSVISLLFKDLIREKL